MRSKGRSAARLILLSVACSCLMLAQSRPNPPRSQAGIRKASVPPPKLPSTKLVDSDQGLAILGAALGTKHAGHAGADCSHLVHAIYERAGFPYTYAPSGDLYIGTDEFRRVAQPQAGDLIVWLGHAGIVVNPREHTFYSALRSGLHVQEYDSPYWKRRGSPHFLRYVREQGVPLLTASNHAANVKPAASVKPVGLRNGGSRESIPAIKIPEDFGEAGDVVSPSDDQPALVPSLPGTVNVETAHPRSDQVRMALVQHFQEVDDALAARDVLKLYPSLVAFEQFEVKKVQLKRDNGWAEIHIIEPSMISSFGGHAKKFSKVQRWVLLRRSADVWELVLPADAVYLPREMAVHLMAHQLAALTDADPSSNSANDDKARLARWLNVLLAESPSR
jgi:hypothetical protein